MRADAIARVAARCAMRSSPSARRHESTTFRQDTRPRNVERVAVIGAGTMGTGIALAFVAAGLAVVLVEADQQALDQGMDRVRGALESAAAKGKLSREEVDRRIHASASDRRLRGHRDGGPGRRSGVRGHGGQATGVRGAGSCREARRDPRDEHVHARRRSDRCRHAPAAGRRRHALLQSRERHAAGRGRARRRDVTGCPRDIDERDAAHGQDRRRSRACATGSSAIAWSSTTCARRCSWSTRARRRRRSTRRSSVSAWRWARSAWAISPASTSVGASGKRRYVERPNVRYSRIADRLCEQGRFGQKTGRGWYRYESGRRDAIPDPDVDALINAYRADMASLLAPLPMPKSSTDASSRS